MLGILLMDAALPELVLRPNSDYYENVKFWQCPSSARSLIVICLFLVFDHPAVQAKPIRLRNEVILTETAAKATSTLPDSPVSGLFLVQFSGPPPPEVRAQLSAAGVDLLRYVPRMPS